MIKQLSVIGGALLGVLTAIYVVAGFYTVDEGHVGVVKVWGKAVAQEPADGLKWREPISTEIVQVDVRERQSKDEMSAGTANQLPITATITTNWSIVPSQVLFVYQNYGSPEIFDARIIDGRIRQAAKAGLGHFQASELIGDRSAAAADILQLSQEALSAYPVTISSSQIENVSMPKVYTDAVLAKEKAREDAAKELYKLEQQGHTAKQKVQTANAERDATIAAADGQAYKVRTEAAAAAEAIKLKGEAEAEAILAKQKAIANNPLIIDYEKARRWDGRMPSTVLGEQTSMLMQLK